MNKALRIVDPNKPPPFPYETEKFTWFDANFADRTLHRLDENSKLIVVEGAHAVGKTEAAKALAEEFGMIYIPPASMEDVYIHPWYGTDFRKWTHLYPDYYKCFDDKDFFRNPKGGAHPATCDHYFHQLYRIKMQKQIHAIRHILNTGQGVVMEGCCHSHYVALDAAYQCGWVREEYRQLFDIILASSLHNVFRPNVIVYLDAPLETVQRNIKARGNEWDKDSPVWFNNEYLSAIYNEYRTNYLKDMQQYCRVVVYDWSQGGDLEVVVEDIEKMELDWLPLYSDDQAEWRFGSEWKAKNIRWSFTNLSSIILKMRTMRVEEEKYSNATKPDTNSFIHMEDVMRMIKTEDFPPGQNWHLGEKPSWKQILFGYDENHYHIQAMFKNNQFFNTLTGRTPYERKHNVGLD